MTAVAQETPGRAARRLAGVPLSQGFRPGGLHYYRNSQGKPVFWRIRLKHPLTGEKWMRPMHREGARFVMGEPLAPLQGKPLYNLPELLVADVRAALARA